MEYEHVADSPGADGDKPSRQVFDKPLTPLKVNDGPENQENGSPLMKSHVADSPAKLKLSDTDDDKSPAKKNKTMTGPPPEFGASPEKKIEDDNEELEIFKDDNKGSNEDMVINADDPLPVVIAKKILDFPVYVVIINIFTLFSLFSSDVVAASFSAAADNVLDYINIIILSVFCVDMILSSIAKPEYRLSFYFFLDLLSTGSLVLDINLIMNQIYGTGGGANNNLQNTASLAKAGRITRIGTRAARVIRIIRLIRIAKVFKAVDEHKKADAKAKSSLRSGTSFAASGEIRASKQNLGQTSGMSGGGAPIGIGDKKHAAHAQTMKIFPIDDSPIQQAKPHGNNNNNTTLHDVSANQPPAPSTNNYLPLEITSTEPKKRNSMSTQEKNLDGTTSPGPTAVPHHSYKASATQAPLKQPSSMREHSNVNESVQGEEDEEFQNTKESNVGKELSDKTTKKVIIVVLLMLLVIPLCDSDYYFDQPTDYAYALVRLMQIGEIASNITDLAAQQTYLWTEVNRTINVLGGGVLLLTFPIAKDGTNFNYNPVDINLYRTSEYGTDVETSNYLNGNTGVIYYDLQPIAILTAGLNIGKTIFICMVLVFSSMAFSSDANEIVIYPIERMIEKVKKIARNPLIAREEDMTVKGEEAAGKPSEQSEVILIEQSIVKIATLLALGFGDAGSNIIATNMARGGDLDPMIPGQRKFGIFGFCDIRNFTDATEVLQTEVMVFVNTIADVVHTMTDKYTGAANKNIGDAFLLVWKIPDTETQRDDAGELMLKPSSRILTNIADLSLISFVKIWGQINRSVALYKYRSNPGLNKRLPNYKVKMGFGLHIGWAIEGAIGSEFKIDASYLSPNVNMASRLEAATKQFGVPLLISGPLHDRFSAATKEKCRQIDNVTVKGSIMPVGFYTCDTDISKLKLKANKVKNKKEMRMSQMKKKKELWSAILADEQEASVLFQTDGDLVKMLDCPPQTDEFKAPFKEAFESYLKGDWPNAKKRLDECLQIYSEDGPSKTLYYVMKETDFMCPKEWKGYRELTEK